MKGTESDIPAKSVSAATGAVGLTVNALQLRVGSLCPSDSAFTLDAVKYKILVRWEIP